MPKINFLVPTMLQLQVQGIARLAVQFTIELEVILAELAGVPQPRVSL